MMSPEARQRWSFRVPSKVAFAIHEESREAGCTCSIVLEERCVKEGDYGADGVSNRSDGLYTEPTDPTEACRRGDFREHVLRFGPPRHIGLIPRSPANYMGMKP